jgi:hypothetical protein
MTHPLGKYTTAGVMLQHNKPVKQVLSQTTYVEDPHDPPPHLLPAEIAALWAK